jgi:hypothetical protein
MRIHPASLLLGLGAAFVLPLFSRVLRPLAVEAAVAGMGLLEEGRRLIAEQVEAFEDIAAEARARREEAIAQTNGHHPEDEAQAEAEERPRTRARRRAEGAVRRQAS